MGIFYDFRNHGYASNIVGLQNALHALDASAFDFHVLAMGQWITGFCNAKYETGIAS